MKRYKARILPSASKDIEAALIWYAQHGTTLPIKFSQKVKSSVEQIRTAPFTHAIRYKEIRIANMSVFPYGIHYLIKDDFVEIIAIHHTAMNPQKWSGRL